VEAKEYQIFRANEQVRNITFERDEVFLIWNLIESSLNAKKIMNKTEIL